MAEHSRYNVSDEDAGIENGVLKNKLGLMDQQSLEDAETLLLVDAYEHFFDLLQQENVVFNTALLFSMHEYFLGPLYDWAGELRRVDISNDGMMFAPVEHLQTSVTDFGQTLGASLPTQSDSVKEAAKKIAIIHNEFNAVHPFREGNGRTIRLFLDLLIASLGLPEVNWDEPDYLSACIDGMSRKHEAMIGLILRRIKTN
ncbi:MAG: Fic family protein [Patescibacteria group bacterium]